MAVATRVALLVAVSALSIAAQEPTLPDAATFLQRAREHLAEDWRLDASYTYMERRTDFGGDPSRQVVRVYQVVPAPNGRPHRRLVEENGRRRTPDELANDEREHEKRVAERQRQLATETPAERQRRLQREAKRRAEEQQTWDDIGRVYTFTIARRETIAGQSLIVVDFTPKADAAPVTENGRRMMKAKGRAWIAENDYQVARVEAQVLDDISIGWGLIGKLYAGATASYVRTKTNGGPWLPQQLSYAASGRALVKRFAVRTVIDYYDFRPIEQGR